MSTYYVSKDGNVTTAVLEHTECQAINRFVKRFGLRDASKYSVGYSGAHGQEIIEWLDDDTYNALEIDKLIMPKSYKATVHRDENDEPDVEKGKQAAYDKAVGNYKKGLTNTFRRWQVAMMMKLYTVSPNTFDSAIEETKCRINRKGEKK